jgi:hypothetical protein
LVNQKQLRFVLLGSGAAVALLASPAVADEVSDLKSQIEALQRSASEQIEALQDRLDQVEVQQTRIEEQQESVGPANAVVGGDAPGTWKLPGSDTSISFSGYVKSDFIYDLGRDVGDTFCVSCIPVDNSANNNADGNVRLHARQSRFRFDSRTPTDWGQLKTRIEGDFFGTGGNERFSNSNSFRLRHAWGQLGPVLAGQTWTTFMDQGTWADTLDFYGPVGVEFVRQAQIRYSTGLAVGLSLDLAVENPEMQTRTLNAWGTAAAANAGIVDTLPDFIAALRYRDSWGAINVAGLGRHFNSDLGAGGDAASSAGWGFHAGATVKLPFIADGDKIVALFNVGQGLGRYLTGSSGSGTVMVHCNDLGSSTPNLSGASPLTNPGCNPTMSVATSWGAMVGGTHKWTSNLYSNAYYGHAQHRYDVNAVGALMVRGLTKSIDSVHANIMWKPVGAVTVGFEFMHGWIDTVSQTAGVEGSGTASRFQLGMKYGF